MQAIKKSRAGFKALLSSVIMATVFSTSFVMATSSENNTDSASISVSCSIESEDYLSGSPVSMISPAYVLNALATQEGGRHLVHQSEIHELWLKTNAYRRQANQLTITGFSAVLIDKQKRQMVEASSSVSEVPRAATLVVHGMTDAMALEGRLTFSCIEVI